MDPKQFPWAEDQTVTVVNPTEKTYKFMAHSKEYEVGPGQTVKMPGFIAWLYVYGLASQLSQAEGTFNRWNEEGFRQQYYDRIVIGADDVVQTVVAEPEIEDAYDLGGDELIDEGKKVTGNGRRKKNK